MGNTASVLESSALLRASSNNVKLKIDHPRDGSIIVQDDQNRKTTSQYHERNSHINSMLMQTFDNNFGQVEDDESMKSEDAKFGFGNTSQNQIMDD